MNQTTSVRSKIEKEIRFLSTFAGEPGTLPSFAGAVNKILTDYPNEEDQKQVYSVIYDTKITGAAKNYLETITPTNWTTCLNHLKKHFRAAKDEAALTKQIGSIRVSSVQELDFKIKLIIEDIAENAAFNENSKQIIDIFFGMLIMKIKELVAGALAAAMAGIHDLGQIRDIVNKFIGQDQGNLKYNNYNNSSRQVHRQRQYQNDQQNNRSFNQSGQYNFRNNTNSGQYSNNRPRQNNQQSGQFTNNRTRQENSNSGQFRRQNNYNNSNRNNNSNNNSSNSNNNYFRQNNAIEPMDTLSASYQRQINIQQSDFCPDGLQTDFHI